MSKFPGPTPPPHNTSKGTDPVVRVYPLQTMTPPTTSNMQTDNKPASGVGVTLPPMVSPGTALAAYMTGLTRTPSAGGVTVLAAGQQPINVARSFSAPGGGSNGTNHGVPIISSHILSPPTQYLPVAGLAQLQQQPQNTMLVTLAQPPAPTLAHTSPQSQAQQLAQSTTVPPPQQQQAQKQPLTTKQQQMLAQAEESRRNYAKRRKVSHACVYCRRSHMTCGMSSLVAMLKTLV